MIQHIFNSGDNNDLNFINQFAPPAETKREDALDRVANDDGIDGAFRTKVCWFGASSRRIRPGRGPELPLVGYSERRRK